MQIRYFWKIFQLIGIFPWKKILRENSHAYMDMPTGNDQSGKSCPNFQRSRWSIERSLAMHRDRCSNPVVIFLQIWQFNSHQYMEILDGKFPYINENATLNGRMKHRLLVL
jgi:hypothetical protein